MLNVKEKSKSSHCTSAVNGSTVGLTYQCSQVPPRLCAKCTPFVYYNTILRHICSVVICFNTFILEYATYKHKTEIIRDLKLEFGVLSIAPELPAEPRWASSLELHLK